MSGILGNDKLKNSIVWTYLPLITTFLPLVGHVGVGDSKGVTHDFAGSNFVSEGKLAFNVPYKAYKLKVSRDRQEEFDAKWDLAIREASVEYSQLEHSLFRNNCHHFVARVLNSVKYEGRSDWSCADVFKLTCLGRYLRFTAFLRTWTPFLFIVIIIPTATALYFTSFRKYFN